MLQKRIFNSTEPLKVLPADTREEPFAEKPFLLLRNLKGFVGKYGTFTVLYETLNGFVKTNRGFIARPLRVPYEAVKDPYFLAKPLKFRSEKRGFSTKGSSHVSARRTYKGSVELKTRCWSILKRFQVYGTF